MDESNPKDTLTPEALKRIVRAVIHPGIGIARLGNSRAPDGFYIGPETIEPPLAQAGDMRDASGALKRQAARFRIYGYDVEGKVVGELTADHAQIQWRAHLANRKAQWYQFDTALDIPEAANIEVPLRNAQVKGQLRQSLAIDPGSRVIGGKQIFGSDYQFDTGEFQGVTVPLGELRTDATGRLLVLGGFGNSGSPSGQPIYDPDEAGSFPNATGWYDDTADGPVSAQVTLNVNGQDLLVESAWVVVAQPNFAPNVVGWRTLYDLLVDTYIDCGWLEVPKTVSFNHDVLPVLQRLSGLQWVNKGFATLFGHGAPFDFNNPQLVAKLARADETYSHLRRTVFNAFRAADNNVHEPRTWPWLYGDTYAGEEQFPNNHLAPSVARSQVLQRWVTGAFINDWEAEAKPLHAIHEFPLAEQPAMLDQAALHFCVADAFHPGIELSWPMRHPSLYRAPFRIKEMPADEPLPDFGPVLDQQGVLACDGPLHAQPAGGLSRWMALPWQVDAVGCRSGYDKDYDPYLPTFWPARVPDQVLSEADYLKVMDSSESREQRLASFSRRERWGRQLSGGFVQQAMQMVSEFSALGVLEARPGIENDADFPAVMLVETTAGNEVDKTAGKIRLQADSLSATSTNEQRKLEALELAGWESAEQYEEFRRILRR